MQRLKSFALPMVLASTLLGSTVVTLPAAAQDACQPQVSTQKEMIDAINYANTRCKSATIHLKASIVTETGTFRDTYNLGLNAFPVINKPIAIEGNNHAIHRNAASGDYRFFSVGGGGVLSINKLTLEGGGGRVGKGGAILVYGLAGKAELKVTNSALTNNLSHNDGGAIQIASVKGHRTVVVIEDSKFHNNAAGPGNKAHGEGGAIYSDGRAGGALELKLVRTSIANNVAGKEGGALRFLSSGSADVTLNVEDSTFVNNSTPQCVFHHTVTIAGSNRATDQSCGSAEVVAA